MRFKQATEVDESSKLDESTEVDEPAARPAAKLRESTPTSNKLRQEAAPMLASPLSGERRRILQF